MPDPLVGLPEIPAHPPDFVPGTHFTQACTDKIDLDPANWLWPEELKLVHWLVHTHELVFAWDTSECGHLDKRYFPVYKIPTVLHTPWSQHNIPILPSTIGEVMCIIKEKISSGVYEPSMALYRSRWFCIIKKDRKSLRLVHNLQLVLPQLRLLLVLATAGAMISRAEHVAKTYIICGLAWLK
ncbi:hypothetical protein BDR05DRAFT_945668 [Suillus weaverae]|nr:hypothetical protein BDR05DRAFT_945668 [Suillus weaverae]